MKREMIRQNKKLSKIKLTNTEKKELDMKINRHKKGSQSDSNIRPSTHNEECKFPKSKSGNL